MKIPKHKLFLFIHDVIMLLFSMAIAYIIYDYSRGNAHPLTKEVLWGYGTIAISSLFLFNANNMYKYQVILNYSKHAFLLFNSLFISMTILIYYSFFFKVIEITVNRVQLGVTFATIFVLFFMTRVFIIPNIYFWLVKNRYLRRNLLVIGADELSIKKVKKLLKSERNYYRVVGFLSDETAPGTIVEGIEVIGKKDDVIEAVGKYKVQDILIASNAISYERLSEIVDKCKRTRLPIFITSNLYKVIPEKLDLEEISTVSAFKLLPSNKKRFYIFIKRITDIVVSSFFILAFLPFWLLLALVIKLDSRGPIFYKARVVGLHGKEFLMYKFRSMQFKASTKLHQEKVKDMILGDGNTEKIKNDPRVTRVGAILRKLSIDEFPQLLNVLRGEMSLVGPRPNVPYEYEIMEDWQKKRFDVLPGMTGLWQIKGRDEVKFAEQIVLDLYYIENRSIMLDLEILLKTVPVVLFAKGGK